MSSDEENGEFDGKEVEGIADGDNNVENLEHPDAGKVIEEETKFNPDNSSGKKRTTTETGERCTERKRMRRMLADSDEESKDDDDYGSETKYNSRRGNDGNKKESSGRASDSKSSVAQDWQESSRKSAGVQESPTVQEVCDSLQLKDVPVLFTEADYKTLTNFKLFQQRVRPILQQGNLKVPTTKLMRLLAAKYREFQKSSPAGDKKGAAAIVQRRGETSRLSIRSSGSDGGGAEKSKPVASSGKGTFAGVGTARKDVPKTPPSKGDKPVKANGTKTTLQEMTATASRVTRLEDQVKGFALKADFDNLEVRVKAQEDSVEAKLVQLREEVENIGGLARAISAGSKKKQSESSAGPIAAVLDSLLDAIRKVASAAGLEIEAVRELTEVMAKLQPKT